MRKEYLRRFAVTGGGGKDYRLFCLWPNESKYQVVNPLIITEISNLIFFSHKVNTAAYCVQHIEYLSN